MKPHVSGGPPLAPTARSPSTAARSNYRTAGPLRAPPLIRHSALRPLVIGNAAGGMGGAASQPLAGEALAARGAGAPHQLPDVSAPPCASPPRSFLAPNVGTNFHILWSLLPAGSGAQLVRWGMNGSADG